MKDIHQYTHVIHRQDIVSPLKMYLHSSVGCKLNIDMLMITINLKFNITVIKKIHVKILPVRYFRRLPLNWPLLFVVGHNQDNHLFQ